MSFLMVYFMYPSDQSIVMQEPQTKLVSFLFLKIYVYIFDFIRNKIRSFKVFDKKFKFPCMSPKASFLFFE